MKRATDIGSLVMGVLTCSLTFLGLTCVFYPDTFNTATASPKQHAVMLAPDGSLPPMTERELWSQETLAQGDWRTE